VRRRSRRRNAGYQEKEAAIEERGAGDVYGIHDAELEKSQIQGSLENAGTALLVHLR
jgi:hypothetical protein